MKMFFLICFVFIISIAQAEETVLELTAENLTLLALKNSPPDIIEDYALSLLKSNHSKKYFKVRKNKIALDELIRLEKTRLIQEISKVTDQQEFKFSKKVRFGIPNKQSPSVQVSSLYSNITDTVFRSFTQNKGLPDYFFLLIANLDILNDIKIEKNAFNQLLESKQKNLYLDIRLVVSNYQNQKDFQVTIKQINLYSNKQKEVLIGHTQENKTHDEIINNWVLSGGLSTKLVGIHAFSVFGYRLQDIIRKEYVVTNICEQANKVNGHQVLFCKHNFTDNSHIITFYIGGVLSQLDLITNQEISKLEKNKIIRALTIGLKKPVLFFNKGDLNWTDHFVEFDFFASSLSFRNDKAPLKIDLNNYNLVFSMKSQKTTAIFEGQK